MTHVRFVFFGETEALEKVLTSYPLRDDEKQALDHVIRERKTFMYCRFCKDMKPSKQIDDGPPLCSECNCRSNFIERPET